VLLHHLVVEAEDKEGCDPLADEEGFMLAAGGLEADGTDDGGDGGSEEDCGWDGAGELFNGCGELVFLGFTGNYAIVGHLGNLLELQRRCAARYREMRKAEGEARLGWEEFR
jgi:hypothetical protein